MLLHAAFLVLFTYALDALRVKFPSLAFITGYQRGIHIDTFISPAAVAVPLSKAGSAINGIFVIEHIMFNFHELVSGD